MSNSLKSHGLKHVRLPCPSLSTGACSNSCSSSQWCHPTISSSVIPFSSCLQSSAASGSFPMTQLFPSGGQNIGASASASVLPMNISSTCLQSLYFKEEHLCVCPPKHPPVPLLKLSRLYKRLAVRYHNRILAILLLSNNLLPSPCLFLLFTTQGSRPEQVVNANWWAGN